MADGRGDEAYARFTRALAVAQQHDAYGAAWLVAECASTLAYARPDLRTALQETVRGYVRQVDGLGFVPLAARYAALLAAPTADERAVEDAAAIASAGPATPRLTVRYGSMREKSA